MQSAINVMNYGIEAMELDVYQTSDYVPYLFHDQTLTRMLNRPEYSDIYRWEREGSYPAGKKPARNWGQYSQQDLCYNGVDGYGKTAEHPTCARLGARVEHGLVEREADLLLGEHDALALPGARRGLHMPVGVLDVLEGSDDHGESLPFCCCVLERVRRSRGPPGRGSAGPRPAPRG